MVQANNGAGRNPGDKCRNSLEELLSPALFKALSDQTRLLLLVRLAHSGEPRTIGQVAEGSGVDLSVVSRHLSILRQAGIIRCEKRGKEVFCAVQREMLARALRELADAIEDCCRESSGALEWSAGVTGPSRTGK